MHDQSIVFDLKMSNTIAEGLTSNQLKSLAVANRLCSHDQIKRTNGTKWQDAGSVPGLAELLTDATSIDSPENHKIESWIESSIRDLCEDVSIFRTDIATTWIFSINQVEMRAYLLEEFFAVSSSIVKLSARQLDDSRLLERLLRTAGNLSNASIGIDSDDLLIVRIARNRADLDLSEVRDCILGVAAAIENIAERVSHLL